MNFTIDDMIEFCKSECDYHTKKIDEKLKLFTENKLDHDSYMLGNSIGFKIAYGNMLESLIKLKEQSDEKTN